MRAKREQIKNRRRLRKSNQLKKKDDIIFCQYFKFMNAFSQLNADYIFMSKVTIVSILANINFHV